MANREPKIYENDKHTLVYSVKIGFFLSKMSLLSPNNIVIGRLHDHEILDMNELGIERYVSLKSMATVLWRETLGIILHYTHCKIDLFRGPKVSRVNVSGIEHIIHFIMPSSEKLLMRVLTKPTDDSTPSEAAPQVDFVIRRRKMPSEDKWKCAMRVPAEVRRKKDKATKNTSMDLYGNRVGQIHLQREIALDEMRPGMSMRTALTGHAKRGFERQQNSSDKLGVKRIKKRKMDDGGEGLEEPKSVKRQKAE
ncbi:unnamed protein product [Hymenolepis diminuta]|uniref:Ribosome production factor 2 homolog n=1 Tax=Hymenolepis diminuta TaxID=6216 RepID=A0A3P6ZF88_HYMDI|nr:unnamed protein product [Hymenolepis diminuta]